MLFSVITRGRKVGAVGNRAEDLDLLGGAVFHLQDYLGTGVCETEFCLLGRKERFYRVKSAALLLRVLTKKKKQPNEQSIPSTRHREVVELQLSSQGSCEHNKAQVETEQHLLMLFFVSDLFGGEKTVFYLRIIQMICVLGATRIRRSLVALWW